MLEAEALSALIATIYDAALDPDMWPRALEGIRRFVQGCAANFYWQEVSKENAGVFHCVGIEPAYLESYFQNYTKLNPLYPTSAFFPPGQVFGSTEVLPFPEFAQTRFYDEWMRPQGMIDSLAVKCPSSDNLRLIRHFEKRGSGSSWLEFKLPAVGAASGGLRWWQA